MTILTVFYDLEYGPVSFDFINFLVRARMAAAARRLHVVIVPHEGGLGGFARHWGKHDAAATRWRLWHILIALCPLAGCTVTLAHSREQAEKMKFDAAEDGAWWPEGKAHFIGPVVDSARAGAKIPLFHATEAAHRYVVQSYFRDGNKRLVTMTLRNQSTDPARNTDPDAWLRMKDALEANGYTVILLADANDALARGRGYAEMDPDLRLALYEVSMMNLIANNGPIELLKFSRAPYLGFGHAPDAGWTDHWKRYCSMNPGDQLPWATRDQRLVYGPATFDVMKKEFERWASATN